MKLVIANFKSNKNREDYENWISTFEKESSSLPATLNVVLAPSTVDLMLFSNHLLDHKLYPQTNLGVQDISPFPAGAYTGAVGSVNLVGFNVTHAIVGHSERRHYFHETYQDVANKVRECVAAKITPIVCVRKDDIVPQVAALEPSLLAQVVVAFEPVDHIGTGAADTLEDIIATKQLVQASFGKVPYIYGGSVDPHTDPNILHSPEIDGFLVGTASLDPQTFLSLLKLTA